MLELGDSSPQGLICKQLVGETGLQVVTVDRESGSSKGNSRALPLLWGNSAQCSRVGAKVPPNLQEWAVQHPALLQSFLSFKIPPKGLTHVNQSRIRPRPRAFDPLTFPYFRLRVCSDTAPSENTDWTSACQCRLRKQGPQHCPVPTATACPQQRALTTRQARQGPAVLPTPSALLSECEQWKDTLMRSPSCR